MTPLLIALALITGLCMGLLGGGGSILVVPLLTFFVGLAPKDAVATSLAIVSLTAAVGAASGLMRGVLPFALAAVVGVGATIGGLIGGAIGVALNDHLQLAILAFVMFGAALLMWRNNALTTKGLSPSFTKLALIGVAIGILTGIVGVGGGFLIVPALVIGAGLSMPQAAAASLFVIAMAAPAALSRYAAGAPLQWTFILTFAVIASTGAVSGGIIAPRLPQRTLQQAFAVVLVVLGSYVLLKA